MFTEGGAGEERLSQYVQYRYLHALSKVKVHLLYHIHHEGVAAVFFFSCVFFFYLLFIVESTRTISPRARQMIILFSMYPYRFFGVFWAIIGLSHRPIKTREKAANGE